MSGRRTSTALALSSLAHAALLAALLFGPRPPGVPPPLSLHLLRLPAEKTLQGALDASASGAQAGRGPPARWLPSARTSRAPPGAVPTLAPPLSLPVPSRGTLEEPAALAFVESQGTEGGAPGPESSGLGASGRGAGLGGSRLGELHRRLAEAATRCYPAAARRFRLKGEVPVHFCLDAAGTATALGLEGSTGSPLLDRSALECVVPGAQPLSGFEGCFLVPVHFGG